MKHKKKTKRPSKFKEKKARDLLAIENKIGKHEADQFFVRWNKLKKRRTTKEVSAEEDGVINSFLDLGFSRLQVGSLLKKKGGIHLKEESI